MTLENRSMPKYPDLIFRLNPLDLVCFESRANRHAKFLFLTLALVMILAGNFFSLHSTKEIEIGFLIL